MVEGAFENLLLFWDTFLAVSCVDSDEEETTEPKFRSSFLADVQKPVSDVHFVLNKYRIFFTILFDG